MLTLDGWQNAVDSIVCQHKSTGVPDSVRVGDFVTGAAAIGYEGVGVTERSLDRAGRHDDDIRRWRAAPEIRQKINAKARPKGATGVAQCVESLPQLRGNAVKGLGEARNALARNMGGPATRPAVSFLEGPAANGS